MSLSPSKDHGVKAPYNSLKPLLCALLMIILINPVSASTNFKKCIEEIRNGTWGSEGVTDSYGNPVATFSQATGITYGLCVRACGSGAEPFELASFSQQFGAWLLPWLALISQLPFGARDTTEDWMSIILTLGSPALAAYSLALTILNTRWLHDKFDNDKDPHRPFGVNVLIKLQQFPIRFRQPQPMIANGPNEPQQGNPAPVVYPPVVNPAPVVDNADWWESLDQGLAHSDRWSIATIVSVGWVIVAYLLTMVGAFGSQSFNDVQRRIGLVGYGIGSLWLWLLPLVVGWQRISPMCDYNTIKKAVDQANGILERDPLEQGLIVCDQGCSPPIFNYARLLPWTRTVDDVFANFHPALGGIFCKWDIFWRFAIASLFGLFLQWSTTSAAVLFAYFTPTRGLGCRSLSYIIYGSASTIVWMCLVASSFLAHYRNTVTRVLSISLQLFGKCLAFLNAAWIGVICILQFANFFSRCYCSSSFLGLRARAYAEFIFTPDDLGKLKSAWIGAAVLANLACVVFLFFVFMYHKKM